MNILQIKTQIIEENSGNLLYLVLVKKDNVLMLKDFSIRKI